MATSVFAGRARIFGFLVFAAACSRARQSNPGGGSPASALGAGPSASPAASDDEDAVQSVYPRKVNPDARAERLCKALHELPQKRRAECQGTTAGVLFTSECVRTLSASLSAGAVAMGDDEVDACSTAMQRKLDGCEWVGAPGPEPPMECEGILHGLLSNGSPCRSSLECAAGLRCHGVGPTRAGRCGPPHDEGNACGTSADSLAAYVRQDHYEESHRECRGVCSRRRCGPRAASVVTSGRGRSE